jgi:WD40 repeat protein
MKSFLAFVCLCSVILAASAEPHSFYDKILQQHHDWSERFKAGDTNTPLLLIEWFLSPNYVQSVRVTKTGMASLGDYGEGGFGSGRGAAQLDSDLLSLITKTMDELPPAPPLPPQSRWLLVSGIRSNQWFTVLYDRADIPVLTENLCKLVYSRAPWMVGDSQSSMTVMSRFGDTWVTSLQAADEAPVALSSSAVASGRTSNSIQLWDLKNGKEITVPAVAEFTTWPWSAVALSVDGKIAALGDRSVRCVDLDAGKILWESPKGEKVIKQLAFVEGEKQLAVAFVNSVEIWDSKTGQMLQALATGTPQISTMKASRDGKLLAVIEGPKKLEVWDVEKRTLVREDDSDAFAIEFSPDSKHLAVSEFSHRDSFVLWNIETGERTIIPARGTAYPDEISELAWSKDGKWFAAIPHDQQLLLYDAHTWKPLTRWTEVGHGARITFAENGTLLARLQDGSLQGLDVSKVKSLAEQPPNAADTH